VTDALSGNDNVADVTQAALTGAAQAVGATAAMIMVSTTRTTLSCIWSPPVSPTRRWFASAKPASLDAPLPHCDTLRSRTITLWRSRLERDIEYPDLADHPADHQAWAFVPLLAGTEVSECSSSLGVSIAISRHRYFAPGRRRAPVRPRSRTGPYPRRRT